MNSIKNKKNTGRKALLFLIFFLFLVISFGSGVFWANKDFVRAQILNREVDVAVKIVNLYSKANEKLFPQDIDFNIFWDAWRDLKEYYVDKDKLTDKKLFYGALKGMTAAAGDPYTIFMEPKIAKEFSDDLAGTFEGIGAEIGIKNDVLTVIAPLPDMPAEKAGLKAGDKILSIDNKNTMGMSIDEAVSRIRGPKGTEVVLSIMRPGFDTVKDFTIKRGKIVVKSVRTNLRSDGIFVIKITSFNEDTKKLFDRATREAIDKNAKAIILDLRNNPGGFFDAAIEVASEWVREGDVVVSEKFYDGHQDDSLARGRPRLRVFPTVVLVNQGSASASEIVAGALKDYGLAIIVGKKTFGKGTVQNLTKLSDNSQLKITVAKWLTPSGLSINEEGIHPDVDVDLTIDDYNADKDPQMEKAVELLLSGKSVSEILSATSTERLLTNTKNVDDKISSSTN